ncbi:hypothetical protein, partial [Mesorhizobium mediterraneum]|uniref:hypothetical protein n=1 Tax=Mesorhizobium mediterraneum TaxID=43617 RepID=UPI001AEDF83D
TCNFVPRACPLRSKPCFGIGDKPALIFKLLAKFFSESLPLVFRCGHLAKILAKGSGRAINGGLFIVLFTVEKNDAPPARVSSSQLVLLPIGGYFPLIKA